MHLSRRVLLLGWDAADWKVMHVLMDRGLMPHTKALVERGVMGNLATLKPVLSPMLWSSIATGKRAHKHGVLGFTEPTPDGTGVQPVTNLSARPKRSGTSCTKTANARSSSGGGRVIRSSPFMA